MPLLAWQKRKQPSQPEPENQPVKQAEQQLQACNSSIITVRNLYITFLLFSLYITIIIASTTDMMLLKESPIRLPLLNIELPIVGFYAAIPWFYLLFHFNLLLNFVLLGRKLRVFENDLVPLQQNEQMRLQERLANFPFAHMLVGRQHDGLIKLLLKVIVYTTLLVVPLMVLLWAQFGFLAHHNVAVTWGHRAAIILDCLLLFALWPRTVSSHSWWAWFLNPILRDSSGKIQIYRSIENFSQPIALIILTSSVLFFSIIAATIPDEAWEKQLISLSNENDQAFFKLCSSGFKDNSEKVNKIQTVYTKYNLGEYQSSFKPASQILCITAWLFGRNSPENPSIEKSEGILGFHRNLDLREQLITKNDLDAVSINTLREELSKQTTDLKEKSSNQKQNKEKHEKKSGWQHAINKTLGFNLQNRQLQYANFSRSLLFRADLRGANINGAYLQNINLQKAKLNSAQMQRADLSEAQMQGADLSEAQMQGADLSEAQMQGADLSFAQMQGTNLSFAQMQGADLRNAKMQGAYLSFAQMQGTNLSFAQMQGAYLSFAKMQGANLRKAKMQGANLSEAKMQGANLRRAQMQGADLSYAQMQGADLSYAEMQGANLTGANLLFANAQYSNFSGANLRFSDLSGANLKGSNFCNAQFHFTQLAGVDFCNIKNIHGADFSLASSWRDGKYEFWNRGDNWNKIQGSDIPLDEDILKALEKRGAIIE